MELYRELITYVENLRTKTVRRVGVASKNTRVSEGGGKGKRKPRSQLLQPFCSVSKE
jgi:hypothetical protein